MNCASLTAALGLTATLLAPIACGLSEKTAALPTADLAERNAVLQEVKKQLVVLETADIWPAAGLLRHSDHRVRTAAAERLALHRNLPLDVVKTLTQTARDPYVSVRIGAIRALTGVGDDLSVDAVIRALADTDSKVRKWAYKGLKKLEKKAVPAMIRHVVSKSEIASLSYQTLTDETKTLADVLLKTLAEMGSAAVPYLVEILKDPDNDSVLKAVSVLQNIGPNAGDAVPALLRLIQRTSDSVLKKNAIDAVANIGDMDPEVMPTLLELSEDNDKTISGAAKQALKKLEEET